MRCAIAFVLLLTATVHAEDLELSLHWPDSVSPLVTQTVTQDRKSVVVQYRANLKPKGQHLVFTRSDFKVILVNGREPARAVAGNLEQAMRRTNVPLLLAADGDVTEDMVEEIADDVAQVLVDAAQLVQVAEVWCTWVCNWLNVPLSKAGTTRMDDDYLEGTPFNLVEYSAIRPLPGQLKLTSVQRGGGEEMTAMVLGIMDALGVGEQMPKVAALQVERELVFSATVIEATLQPLRASIVDKRYASDGTESKTFLKRTSFTFDWEGALP